MHRIDKLAFVTWVPLKSIFSKSPNSAWSQDKDEKVPVVGEEGWWADVMATQRKGKRSRRAKNEKILFWRSRGNKEMLLRNVV